MADISMIIDLFTFIVLVIDIAKLLHIFTMMKGILAKGAEDIAGLFMEELEDGWVDHERRV